MGEIEEERGFYKIISIKNIRRDLLMAEEILVGETDTIS